MFNYLNSNGRLSRFRSTVRVGREGIAMSYLDLPGDDIPVVFLHGAAGCAVQWEVQAERLSGRHRVLVADMRGHGQSDKPTTSYRTDDFMDDMVDWMDEVGLDGPFYMVGHSFGGYMATLLAHRFPARVRRLVLMNTTGNLRHLGILPRTAASLPSPLLQAVHRAIPVLVSAPPHVTRLFMVQALAEWECWDVYPEIQCPTLVITGRWDAVAPVAHARRIASLLPDGRMQVFSFSRHMTMLERAGPVAETLDAFFSGTWQGPRVAPLGLHLASETTVAAGVSHSSSGMPSNGG